MPSHLQTMTDAHRCDLWQYQKFSLSFFKRNLIILFADIKIQKQSLKTLFFQNFSVFVLQGRSISVSCLLSYNFEGCEGAEFLFPTFTRVIYSLLLSFTESQNSITSSHGITICQHKQVAYYIPRFTSGNILSRNWVSPPLGDRKSAKSWLLLSSGCCRSFFETERTK